jgi:hypothetical protein
MAVGEIRTRASTDAGASRACRRATLAAKDVPISVNLPGTTDETAWDMVLAKSFTDPEVVFGDEEPIPGISKTTTR